MAVGDGYNSTPRSVVLACGGRVLAAGIAELE
jgi:hypothetical protein